MKNRATRIIKYLILICIFMNSRVSRINTISDSHRFRESQIMKYYFLICIFTNKRVSRITKCSDTYRFRESRILKYNFLITNSRVSQIIKSYDTHHFRASRFWNLYFWFVHLVLGLNKHLLSSFYKCPSLVYAPKTELFDIDTR